MYVGQYFEHNVVPSSISGMPPLKVAFKVLKEITWFNDSNLQGNTIYECLMDWGEIQQLPVEAITASTPLPKLLGVLKVGS